MRVSPLLPCLCCNTALYTHPAARRLRTLHLEVSSFARCAGLLHTIIFNRALGPVRPREVDSELFDITYVRSLARG